MNAQVHVLIHELAHALGSGYEEFGCERAEVLVDCAAFCVLQTFGLDTAGATIPYVAGWGEKGALDAVQIVRRANRRGRKANRGRASGPSSTAAPTAAAP